MSNEYKVFKGIWIPRQIINHPSLTAIDKMLWADIDSVSGENRGWVKMNKTVADEFGVSERSITRAISKLKEAGLVKQADWNRRVLTTHGVDYLSMGVDKLAREGRQIGEARVAKLSTIDNNIENTLEKTKESEIQMGQVLAEAWAEWLADKKERKESYTGRGARAAFTRLMNLAKGNESVAVQIIHQSLANSWKGFFPLKHDKGYQPTVTADGLHDFIAEG